MDKEQEGYTIIKGGPAETFRLVNPERDLAEWDSRQTEACVSEWKMTRHSYRQIGACVCGQKVLTLVHLTHAGDPWANGGPSAWTFREVDA